MKRTRPAKARKTARSCRGRRDFLLTLGLGAAAVAAPSILRGVPRRHRKPNIVLILADDLGFSDIIR